MKKHVVFTLRFDADLYQRTKTACLREGRSMTAFVQDAVARTLAKQDAAALFQAFTLVGEDLNEANVEYAHVAQREVALWSR